MATTVSKAAAHPRWAVSASAAVLAALAASAAVRPARAESMGGASISMAVTGSLDGRSYECPTGSSLALPAGTTVFLCWEVTNTGSVTLTRHDLVDGQFGAVLTNFPFTLVAGASAFLVQYGPLTFAGNDAATWTAYNPGPTDVATDGDVLTIGITPPLLSCNGPTSTFSGAALPPGWTSFDALAWPSASGDSSGDWGALDDCGETGNYTGGRGGTACASSAMASPGAFDTQLRSHRFSLAGQSSARVEFRANYQDFDAGDALDVDVSLDGFSFSNLFHRTLDLGDFRSGTGAAVSLDLASVVGQAQVWLRWRYADAISGADAGYVQVDDIRLVCGNGIFSDGFGSGDTHAWSAAVTP
jgi:hypothetical protein